LIHQGANGAVQFSGWGPWGFLDDPEAGYALNDWTMVTVVANYSSYTVYVDGVHQTGNQLDAPIGTSDLGGNDIFVGLPNAWTVQRFEGKVDEYTVWSSPMTAQDVANLFKVFEVDPNYSSNPSPANVSTGVAYDTDIVWSPSVNAGDQDLYFGTDFDAVTNADQSSAEFVMTMASDTSSYPITDDVDLMLGETYYWRVDAVDDVSGLWKGKVWQFSLGESILIDDFESYDTDGNNITAVWTDKIGWGDIQVLLIDENYTDPYLSPVNSMKLRHRAVYEPYYAIAARSFSPAQDWTLGGVRMLSFSYYGEDDNFGIPMLSGCVYEVFSH